VGLGIAGVGVAALLGKPVLRVFYRPEYAQHTDVLVVLMVAGGLSYISSFLGYALTAARYLKVQVVVNALAVLSVLISGWWLIPRLGLMGAAWSVTIAGGVRLVLLGGLAVQAARGGETAETKAA
jgi:O-antigen/teichoic acid export membrane protein